MGPFKSDFLRSLSERGYIHQITDADGLDARARSGVISAYIGFDATADSLHIGSLVPLLALRRFQLLGHHPIALAGGATGSIGDPSGKSDERQLLTSEVLNANIASVKEQLRRLLDFDTHTNPARLMDNATWTAPVSWVRMPTSAGGCAASAAVARPRRKTRIISRFRIT